MGTRCPPADTALLLPWAPWTLVRAVSSPSLERTRERLESLGLLPGARSEHQPEQFFLSEIPGAAAPWAFSLVCGLLLALCSLAGKAKPRALDS